MKWIAILAVLLVLIAPVAAKVDLTLWSVGDDGMATCTPPPSEAPVNQKLSWTFTSAVTGESSESYIQKQTVSVNRMDGIARDYGYRSAITTDAPSAVQTFDSLTTVNVTPLDTNIVAAHVINAYNGIGSQSISSNIRGVAANSTLPFSEKVVAGQEWNQNGEVSLTASINAQDSVSGIPLTIDTAAEINGFRATYFDSGTIQQVDSTSYTGNTTDTTFSENSYWSNTRTIIKNSKTSGVFTFKSKHGAAVAS